MIARTKISESELRGRIGAFMDWWMSPPEEVKTALDALHGAAELVAELSGTHVDPVGTHDLFTPDSWDETAIYRCDYEAFLRDAHIPEVSLDDVLAGKYSDRVVLLSASIEHEDWRENKLGLSLRLHCLSDVYTRKWGAITRSFIQ